MALRRPFLADFFHFFRRFKTHLKTRKIAKNTRFYRQFHKKYRWTQAKQPSCQKTACPAEEMPGAKGGTIVFTANGGKCANIKTIKRSEIVGCAEFFVRTQKNCMQNTFSAAQNQINAVKFSKSQSQAPMITIALIIIDSRSAKFICIAPNHIRLRHKD